jgi:hypothetical protein
MKSNSSGLRVDPNQITEIEGKEPVIEEGFRPGHRAYRQREPL